MTRTAITTTRRLAKSLAPSGPLRTAAETAEQLRTTVSALYNMRHRGQGPRAIKQGRRLLYAQSDIDAYIARLYAEQG
ncbi:helix-turn-helix transcriptional regulator [Frankia sp. CiP1_Cm_nod2]|uniref:helix-turn-helix transcriptional regulator n=1 Tax=Frankia sp. CiP1_Cm_nod2 TaxID=2897161 RepID=UPI004043DF84